MSIQELRPTGRARRLAACAGAFVMASLAVGCSSPPIAVPPVPGAWADLGPSPDVIQLEADGSASVRGLPVSEPGSSCDPRGTDEVTESATWLQRPDGIIEVSGSDWSVFLEPRFQGFAPDWEVVYVTLCAADAPGTDWYRFYSHSVTPGGVAETLGP